VAQSGQPAAVERGIAPSGYRLPDAAHIGGVRLQVSDLQQSIEYYRRVLGLSVIDSTRNSAALAPSGGTTLLTLESADGIHPSRRGAFGLFHFAVLLPDRPALGRFAAHLVTLDAHVGAADHLVSEAFYLSDPDGLGIEVYGDRPRSSWQYHGRQLAMTTDPLDVRSVIAAANGQPWKGAPAGTTMGHVHLHVGNLDDAATFYHRALGFDETVWDYPGALFMSAGGYHHHLGVNTWAPGPASPPDRARLLDWELVVPSAVDVGAAAASLQGAGYSVDSSADTALASDPWGTRVRIRAER
jgi:catechol 2,3-dioxygenase